MTAKGAGRPEDGDGCQRSGLTLDAGGWSLPSPLAIFLAGISECIPCLECLADRVRKESDHVLVPFDRRIQVYAPVPILKV